MPRTCGVEDFWGLGLQNFTPYFHAAGTFGWNPPFAVGPAAEIAICPCLSDTVELIPTLGALFPRGGPVQDLVGKQGGERHERAAYRSCHLGPKIPAIEPQTPDANHLTLHPSINPKPSTSEIS